jgi:hypothetical protein
MVAVLTKADSWKNILSGAQSGNRLQLPNSTLEDSIDLTPVAEPFIALDFR